MTTGHPQNDGRFCYRERLIEEKRYCRRTVNDRPYAKKFIIPETKTAFHVFIK